MKMPVYYSPTQTNRILIEKLIRERGLGEFCGFHALSHEPDARAGQLKKITGPCVYLWGDGGKHHESFYLTLGTGIELKINVDAHQDTYSLYQKDPGLGDPPGFDTHMLSTELTGVRIITGPESLHVIDVIREGQEAGKGYGSGKVSVTVDGDGIYDIPVLSQWLYMASATIENVLDLLKTLGNRVHILDIGGLVENIPEFELVTFDRNNLRSANFARIFEMDPRTPEGQKRLAAITSQYRISRDEINRVGSYCLEYYERLIREFATIYQ